MPYGYDVGFAAWAGIEEVKYNAAVWTTAPPSAAGAAVFPRTFAHDAPLLRHAGGP